MLTTNCTKKIKLLGENFMPIDICGFYIFLNNCAYYLKDYKLLGEVIFNLIS